MAERPWITPEDVREYTENETVRSRSDKRLNVDITRAEQYILTATNNDFSEYKEIPSAVKTAALILAEGYANNAINIAKNVKSETLDDYSYTSDNTQISADNLDISALLDPYIKKKSRTNLEFRLRRI